MQDAKFLSLNDLISHSLPYRSSVDIHCNSAASITPEDGPYLLVIGAKSSDNPADSSSPRMMHVSIRSRKSACFIHNLHLPTSICTCDYFDEYLVTLEVFGSILAIPICHSVTTLSSLAWLPEAHETPVRLIDQTQ